ncbi:endonuclease/exonuclease/phosphatase family protein [Kineosporia sp. NBRC 101677]|uniref:endonuclease/exonuclease/phosphatase family protein n=1 Tax=Kineosporia sp. NBRC 101677 TaxID=3032197 RepID=UPI0025528D1B|nr:endonuclease/exonuclease/phosphatase family protein [Kineosporia sp. NBRC 101677]
MTSPGESARLRLGSLNLFSGRSSRGVMAGPQALAEAVRTLDVDVLAGQEVDSGQPRSGGANQAAQIAQAMNAPYARFAATVLGTPGEPGWTGVTENVLTDVGAPPGREVSPHVGGDVSGSQATDVRRSDSSAGPAYGVCLVSRIEVERWHELRLPPSRGRFPLVVPGRPARMMWLRDEPRVALAAQLATGVTVVCTHLSFVPGVNVRQLRQIRRWLEGLQLPAPGRPVIVMGDLNMPPMPARRATGWHPLVSGPTFPALRPGVQLDHVLGAGLPPGVSASGELVPDLPVGDHRAVRVALDLRTR